MRHSIEWTLNLRRGNVKLSRNNLKPDTCSYTSTHTALVWAIIRLLRVKLVSSFWIAGPVTLGILITPFDFKCSLGFCHISSSHSYTFLIIPSQQGISSKRLPSPQDLPMWKFISSSWIFICFIRWQHHPIRCLKVRLPFSFTFRILPGQSFLKIVPVPGRASIYCFSAQN